MPLNLILSAPLMERPSLEPSHSLQASLSLTWAEPTYTDALENVLLERCSTRSIQRAR